MVEYKESKNHYAASDSYDLCSIYYCSCDIYGDCYFAYGMIETPSDTEGADNEISMYAFEGKWTDLLHDELEEESSYYSTRLYRYTIRIDGFAGYRAGWDGGSVVTKPVN